MGEAKKTPSRYWWFDSHNNHPKRSQWLQSTLEGLDEKTSSMLQIIEEDADSFAQRAEMYYKKRPELISMVEELYRAHRSLAERFDQVKSDIGTRPTKHWASPLSFKYQTEKLIISTEKSYDSYSESYDPEESGESEVDDPEQEEEVQVDKEMEEEEVSSGLCNDEAMKLRLELERLKEENRIQKEQLMQKDEEKKVIRQLSSTVDMLKEENVKLRKYIAKNSPKKWSPLEFNKLKTPPSYDPEESGESEVYDPEQEEEVQVDKEMKEEEVSSGLCNDEAMKLRLELERLKEENRIQKEQLMQKDEEKKVIRQLSSTVDMVKEENVKLTKYIAKNSPKKWSPLEFNKLKTPPSYDPEESGESEVDDPEQEEEVQVDKEMEEEEVSSGLCNDEAMKLRLELERLKEENRIQEEQLMQKDEEKREVIRQLSSTVDMLKEENVKLRKYISKNSPKKWSPLEFDKLKAVILGKLFNESPKSHASVAL
ncbi:protein NETWORKED 4B [Cornus florida]|uniref:protein NETWORKED 4B n=1 Tax=Cornus florida TaxID=4283 RepID=UPI00289BC41D|nr:protein NETWORKED 4B [Cornus florida]XP_059625756.1 protein NETWORKED 4B [Cornus florida]